MALEIALHFKVIPPGSKHLHNKKRIDAMMIERFCQEIPASRGLHQWPGKQPEPFQTIGSLWLQHDSGRRAAERGLNW